jgi:hypothetical protein
MADERMIQLHACDITIFVTTARDTRNPFAEALVVAYICMHWSKTRALQAHRERSPVSYSCSSIKAGISCPLFDADCSRHHDTEKLLCRRGTIAMYICAKLVLASDYRPQDVGRLSLRTSKLALTDFHSQHNIV